MSCHGAWRRRHWERAIQMRGLDLHRLQERLWRVLSKAGSERHLLGLVAIGRVADTY